MGVAKSILKFGGKVEPLAFQPKAKDESNKLRRKNSLHEAIIEYLDFMDQGDKGVKQMVEEARLRAMIAADKKEKPEDPRVAGLNVVANQVRAGNMRTLRGQITNHFKTINRRFQAKHALNSLLHICAIEAYLPMIKIIFDDTTRIPADREVPILVDSKNQRGRTPLHLAFGPPTLTWNASKLGMEADGKTPKSVMPEGITMQSDWVKPGDLGARRMVVRTLIKEGADYESRDILEFTPLHYASVWGWEDCVQELIDMDADLAPITSTGQTPLMMACGRGHLKVVRLLLNEGDGESADLEAVDSMGDTALMCAIRRGHFPTVLVLVEVFGANVDAANFAKETPLLLACGQNSLDMVNLLLDFEVEPDPAAFELLRGQVAVLIRQRLAFEAGDLDGDDPNAKQARVRSGGHGAWVQYKEVKPGRKKVKKGTKEPVFYYNTVTRVTTRQRPPDFKRDMLHVPKKAMYGMHFYH